MLGSKSQEAYHSRGLCVLGMHKNRPDPCDVRSLQRSQQHILDKRPSQAFAQILHIHHQPGQNHYRHVDEDEEIEKIFSLKILPTILGNSNFVQTIEDRFFVAKLSPEVPESRQLAPLTMEAIKKAVCEAQGVTENVLISAVRGMTNDPSDISIYLSRILKGDNLKQIGEHFKNREVQHRRHRASEKEDRYR